jgi:hypothetical protein
MKHDIATAEDDDIRTEQLRELIAALDRRVPHIERSGEIDIARDAAELNRRPDAAAPRPGRGAT